MNGKVLLDEEIDKIFEIKSENENISLGHLINKIKEEIPEFDYNDSKIKNELIIEAISVNGDLRNNNPRLRCKKCKGKYIVSYLYGDVFYRLFNGSKKQRLEEKRRFDNLGLFINISPYGQEKNEFNYCCLSCGNKW